MNKIIFFSGMVWLWVGSACAVGDQLAIGSSLPLVPVAIKVREFLQEPLFTAKKKPEINGFMNISVPVMLGLAGILCIGPTFYFLKKWWDRSWKELLVLPSSLFHGEDQPVKNGEVDQGNNLTLSKNQPVKKRKVLQSSQFPKLPHVESNCWINTSIWAIYMVMPELIESLQGEHGDQYLSASIEGAKGFKLQRIEMARFFTKIIRLLKNDEDIPIEFSKEFSQRLLGGAVGEGSPYYAFGLILGSLTLDYPLWSAQVSGWTEINPLMFTGVEANIQSPEDFKELNVTGLGNESIPVLEEVGPFLIFRLSYKLNRNNLKELDPIFLNPFYVPSEINIEQFVSENLRKKMIQQNRSFEYKLVATIIYQGWSHVVAYGDNDNDKGSRLMFDDIAFPQTSSTTQNLSGPWKNGLSPQILIYRRKDGGDVVSVVPPSKNT